MLFGNFTADSYRISDNIQIGYSHIIIYYKGMRIEWVLEEFLPREIDDIARSLLPSRNIEYDTILKSFTCKNKWGWNKLEKILIKHYQDRLNNNLPNDLLFLSLYNFMKNNEEWDNIC